MNENMFESMAERLRTDISKEIAYAYTVFIPKDAKTVISTMKSNIALSDRKFLEQDLQKAVGKRRIFPYDVLNSSLEKHITDFYDDLNLSIKTTEKLSAYGGRGEKFKKEFADSLEQSKASTLKSVMHEMNLQMMQSKDAKSAVDHIQKVLSKRLSYLKTFLKAGAGQLTQYMILWDYQDKGYTHYRLKVNGDTCEKCTDLEGKVFPISEAKSGVNFAPIHPNCDCVAEVLDENGNTVFMAGEKTENKENNDSLEYLQASLRQIVLGNYTDDVNLVGTLGQVLLGILGWDVPADIRDLAYDITNFKMSPQHIIQTLLDFVALLPVVGGIKYIDEAGDVLKTAAKHADEAAEVVKSINPIDDIFKSKYTKETDGNIFDYTTTQITNNLGNSISVMPSKKHYVVIKNPGYKGMPNSSIDIVDETGEVVTRRWYDAQGNAYRDVDFTNHGNSATHPEWPHEHIWKYNEDGKPIGR